MPGKTRGSLDGQLRQQERTHGSPTGEAGNVERKGDSGQRLSRRLPGLGKIPVREPGLQACATTGPVGSFGKTLERRGTFRWKVLCTEPEASHPGSRSSPSSGPTARVHLWHTAAQTALSRTLPAFRPRATGPQQVSSVQPCLVTRFGQGNAVERAACRPGQAPALWFLCLCPDLPAGGRGGRVQ